MAEGTSSGEIHDNALCIVTQSKKTASVWNYFHFRKRDRCNKAALYKLCEKAVVNVGGTTNLKNYLCMWHRKEYDEPYSQTAVRAQQPLTNFLKTATPTRMAKFPACSKHAKTLMQGVAEFIAKDLHPISVVDGVGFLNLMHLAEPRYIVPCRATMTARINEMYTAVKEQVAGVVAQQQHLALTSYMWTSHASEGYISLTCHCVTLEFEMFHKNLQTQHLPGVHDHEHITEALQAGTREWGIDLEHQVNAFTTDNGSNIVKSIEEDLSKLQIPCAGHTLNLSVQIALKAS